MTGINRKHICIDIGGTAVKYGIYDPLSQRVTAAGETATPGTGPEIQELLPNLIRPLLRAGNGAFEMGPEVCISSSGIIDSARGVIADANESIIPGYTGCDIAGFLKEQTGLPCHVENDVKCAALAEFFQGAAKGARSSLTMTVGTGIGAAFIYDRQLLKGHTFSAGEIGYMHMRNGAQEGSFEELASTAALVRKAEEETGTERGSLNGKILFERARGGDEISGRLIREMCDILGRGIANMCYMLNPQVVVIGGGISAQSDYLRPLLEESLTKYLIPSIRRETCLSFAVCGNHAGMIGAYYAWKNDLEPKVPLS